jgi:hypothetical protein
LENGDVEIYLSLGDLGLDCRPGLTLGSIRKQVHNNGTLGDSLVDLEESLSWNPSILLSILPRLAVLAYTNNDVETLITHVQGLGVTLGAISDDCHCVILEEFLSWNQYVVRWYGEVRTDLELCSRPVSSLWSNGQRLNSIISESDNSYRRHPL